MALIKCKECEKEISSEADTCPRCGVPNPNIPYEFEKLHYEYKRISDDKKNYLKLAQKHYDEIDGFLLRKIRTKQNELLRGKVKKYMTLAEKSQNNLEKIQEKMDDIKFNYEQKLDSRN